MITLVKFIRNQVVSSDNHIITRTLGKVGVVKKEVNAVLTQRPQHDEFWYVDILGEIKENQAKGCWILRPLRKIGTIDRRGFTEPDIIRLIPGTFEIEKLGNTLYVYPYDASPEGGPNWILDTELRHGLMAKYREGDGTYSVNSIMVVFDEPMPHRLIETPTEQKEDPPIFDVDAMAREIDQT